MEAARPEAGLDARRRLADRIGLRHRRLPGQCRSRLHASAFVARAAGPRSDGGRGHRHRGLHLHRPDRCRPPGPADRAGGRRRRGLQPARRRPRGRLHPRRLHLQRRRQGLRDGPPAAGGGGCRGQGQSLRRRRSCEPALARRPTRGAGRSARAAGQGPGPTGRAAGNLCRIRSARRSPRRSAEDLSGSDGLGPWRRAEGPGPLFVRCADGRVGRASPDRRSARAPRHRSLRGRPDHQSDHG